MKRLCCFDFDGCLMQTPEKEIGILQWEKHYGQKYSNLGWWGRKESLDTDAFDIKPFPNVLAQLEKEKATPETMVIILTSRMEKLRLEVEKILDINNIIVDEVILKHGSEDKGDVILNIEKYNQDLKQIVVYDDFANKDAGRIAEYTRIKDKLRPDIQYDIYYVNNDSISLLEGYGMVSFDSTNRLLKIINEEIKNL